jgi:hypothetical protein
MDVVDLGDPAAAMGPRGAVLLDSLSSTVARPRPRTAPRCADPSVVRIGDSIKAPSGPGCAAPASHAHRRRRPIGHATSLTNQTPTRATNGPQILQPLNTPPIAHSTQAIAGAYTGKLSPCSLPFQEKNLNKSAQFRRLRHPKNNHPCEYFVITHTRSRRKPASRRPDSDEARPTQYARSVHRCVVGRPRKATASRPGVGPRRRLIKKNIY